MMDIKNFFGRISGKANSPKVEQEFRETCLLYESQSSTLNPSLAQYYQEFLNHYHKITSLYLIHIQYRKIKLIIYDTESEAETERVLDTPNQLSYPPRIAQLPNGDLFCLEKEFTPNGKAFIIDDNFEIRTLPSGPTLHYFSAVYFNNDVYCFAKNDQNLSYFCKFNLNENRWVKLTPMPKCNYIYTSVPFNGKILACGSNNWLLQYSIEADTFSIIYYEIKYSRKLLINVEKLYLLEFAEEWIIHEGEDDYNLKQVVILSKWNNDKHYYYCSYNKGGIYMAVGECGYFKFDLKEKSITKIERRE